MRISGLACALALVCVSLPALEVRPAADTLTIHAEKAPLRDILAKLQESGINVGIDDRINPIITANFENREMGEAIKHLLSDCDYALSWQTIEGPAGKIRRISEILVYKPGDRRVLKPLPSLGPTVAQARTSRTNSIVCLKNEILIRLRAGATREQFREFLMRTGGMVMDGLPALSLYRVRLPPGTDLAAVLNDLAKDPLVGKVEPNQVYRSIVPIRSGAGDPATPRTLTSSQGAPVAVLDSGFTPNSALEKAVVATLDATAPWKDITDPLGHGTQMAYIASGAVTPTGVAADSSSVPIIPIRTMDEQGISSSFSLMQSMVFALDHGARVISMSWGSENNSGFFNDAIAYARQQGAVLVAAAGNEPTGHPLYPAALPDVVAVAALAPDGNMWDQSNYGSFVKFAAPGFASLPVGYKGDPGMYGGTSIAAAYTARAISEYFVAHPKADAADAIAALTKSLSPATGASGVIHAEIPRFDNAAISAYLK